MSENAKPLIFIEPLSATLKKLKEVLEENSEAEGIEIFEVSSVEEAAQLIPTIGQAVILTASPKTCAVVLQTNRKFIKKLQTKTLLLTPKAIPRKTLDKFMKVGLTECIVEPVNPKTLLYKVRLQLRSISTDKAEDDADMQKKFSDESEQEKTADHSKLRAEKGVILDEEEQEEKKRKEYKEETLEDYSKPNKKKHTEDNVIDGFYRGNNKKNNQTEFEDEEETKKKSGYQEEAIDGHYKGNIQKAIEEEEIPAAKREKLDIPDMEEDLEAIKRQVNLQVEEDFQKKQRSEIEAEETSHKKKNSATLDVENEKTDYKASEREAEDLGGHYKGDVSATGLDVEDDEEPIKQAREAEQYSHLKSKKSQQLNVEDDEDEYLNKKEAIEEIEPQSKKQKNDIEIEEEDKDFIEKPQLHIEDDDESKDYKREDDTATLEKKDKPSTLDLEDDEDKDKHDKSKADEIDGYLRGGKAKKQINIEDDEEDIYKDDLLEEKKKKNKDQAASLDIYDEDNKNQLQTEEEYEQDELSAQKKPSLIVDDEVSKKKKQNQEYEDDKDRSRSSYQEEDNGGFGKGHSAHTENKKDRHSKSNSKADHIKTHYDSRNGIKHGEGNWDSDWEKSGTADQDYAPLKKEDSLSYENEDLGEQTIDYAQLKKEFEGIDYEINSKKKKEYGDFDQIAEVKTYTKTILDPTGSLDTMEFEEISKAQEEQESHQVFLPDSKGIENVIEVLNFYYQDKVQYESIYNFITFKINDLFKSDLALYFIDDKAQLELGHLGAVVSQLGPKLLAPKEEDCLSKKEFKEMLKEYDEEAAEYRKNALDIQKYWKEKWETRFSDWMSYQTPTWRDHTFQEVENEFVFPFYEGVTLLGMAVVTPKEEFIEAKAETLEVMLESLRAPMLSEYHREKGPGKQRTKVIPEKKEPKGLLKKWFGKLAG